MDHDRIAIDPQTCHGQARIAGTRIMVSVIVDCLANGDVKADILAAYPSLTREDVQAVRQYAIESTPTE
ncbi:DUF433 domain-containing protein [bacterium]|nr:DUF433 domain-containing protein [bacterium]